MTIQAVLHVRADAGRKARLPWLRGGLAALLLAADPARLEALNPAHEVTQYNCRTWNRQTGLPASVVNSLAQSADDYLWLGTSAGLVRFDGYSFTANDLSQTPGVNIGVVSVLAPSRHGGVWVGLQNSAYGFFDGEKFSFRGHPDRGRTDMFTRAMFEGKDGALWLAGHRQLARIMPDGRYEEVYGDSKVATPHYILCAYEGAGGRIWFGTANHGLLYWQDGRTTELPDPSLAQVMITSLYEDPDGLLWVGTSEGLRCYDAAGRRQTIPALTEQVQALRRDRDGNLWIGTWGRGLVRYRDGVYSSLGPLEGLADAYVNCIIEDREGSLWVGTRNGLSQLTDVRFPTHLVSPDRSHRETWSVASSRQGGVWVGSTAGLTYYDGKTTTYSEEAGIPPPRLAKRIFEATNGDVYLIVGGPARTLAIMSGGKVVATHTASNMFVGMTEDAHGVVVSNGGSLLRVDRNKMTKYAFDGPEPPLEWVLNLYPSSHGGFWVGCGTGIFHVKDGAWKAWPPGPVRPELVVGHVVEDSDGVVWGSTMNGILRLKGDQLTEINRSHGLYDNDIHAVVPDDFGYLWVDSGQGIFRVARQEMNDFAEGRISRVRCQSFEGPESVRTADKTSQERTGCKTLDGRIWFPSPLGFIEIDPARVRMNPRPPPVHIDRLIANGREQNPRAETVDVSPGRGELEFHFAALTYIAPRKTRFRYQLKGYDPDWVDAGARRLAFYTNLPAGNYLFQVTAANADGVWNPVGASLRLTLRPHFYETIWFYSLCAGSLAASLGGAYLMRVRQLRQRQRALQRARDQLEIEVQHRTAELARVNDSLQHEVEDHRRTEAELAKERDLLRTLLDSSPDLIYFKDLQSRFVHLSQSFFARFGFQDTAALLGKTDFDLFAPEHAQPAYDDEQEIIRTGKSITGKVEKEVHLDGKIAWMVTTKMPWRDPNGAIVGTFGISKDITELKQAEEKLAQLHRQLLDASRAAGMAEIATGVLHNVGNVLNSVNVSATLVADKLRQSKAANLAKVNALIDQHKTDLGAFFTSDPKGQMLPSYLASLAETLAQERDSLTAELADLRKNIEHIKEIVAMQQSYAKTSGFTETIEIVELVEDALRMNAGALARHRVEVQRDYQARPTATVDKHKVMQILVNLIRNAKYACSEAGPAEKRIVVRVTADAQGVKIQVIDNGVGIPPENLTRIFSHGFTTRKEGHGFGLHSGANAARELGGSLTVQSAGPGRGACFTLELPYAKAPAGTGAGSNPQ